MAWIRAVALGVIVAVVTPFVTTLAQDKPVPEAVAEAPKSAKEVHAAIQKLAQGLGKNPTDAQIDELYGKAFKIAADYVKNNPEAKDHADIYKWAGSRALYGKSHEGFLYLANSYLKANPDAKDAANWRKFYIAGGLGNETYKAEATAELKRIDTAAEKDAASAVLAAEIRIAEAEVRGAADAKARVIEGLRKNALVAASQDLWVGRDAMRIVLGASKAEIRDGETFPCWSEACEVKDLDGKSIKIADFKGKVVLIDFWAVWSSTGVGQVSGLVKTYHQFKDRGFDVIGVSLDTREGEQGLRDTIRGVGKAGERTGVMPWRQIYDGGYWNAGMAMRYGISDIPRSVLIDKDGKVVAQNLVGKALENKLTELLGAETPKEGGK